MSARIAAASSDLKQIFALLASDVEAARAYGQYDPSPFAHRTLFRTYFAQIDGLCYNLRRISLECALAVPGLFEVEEVVLLRECKFALNEKGVPETKPEYSRVLPNILFSLRMYAKSFGAEFVPDTSLSGWAAMQEFVRLRNGLEHPKTLADLSPSEAQMRSAVEAAGWWKSTVLKLFEACANAELRFHGNGPNSNRTASSRVKKENR